MNKLERLYGEWLSFQPLKQEDQKRLDRKFMLEFNYNSNHLEGNTLTYGQTKLLFMFGETSGSASLRDYEEMKAHNVGLEMLKREAMDKERPLTEQFIRELNHTILVQDFWKEAKTPLGKTTRTVVKVGSYKSRPNSVLTATGEEFHYATPEETPAFMTELIRWYNEESKKDAYTPIELAALLHYRYIRIHPFEDGNGRIARLLVNYVLYRNGYPMIVIHTADKQNYLRVLHQCDIVVGLTPSDGANAALGEIRAFVEYLEACVERALVLGIKAAKGEDIEEENDFEKELAILGQQKRRADGEVVNRFSKENVLDVLEKVYKPFVKELEKVIVSVEPFFTYVKKSYYICKGVDPFQNEYYDIFSSEIEAQSILECARTLYYRIDFADPKREYRMKPISPVIDGLISLEYTYYFFSAYPDKHYAYGTYPSFDDIMRIIKNIKENILVEIKNA